MPAHKEVPMKPAPGTVRALAAWTAVLEALVALEQDLAQPGRGPEAAVKVQRLEAAVVRAAALPIPRDDRSRAAEALRLVLAEVTAALDALADSARALSGPP
jgi:hypothetical protein